MDSQIRVVRLNGFDYVQMDDGRLIPTISGGRGNDPTRGRGATQDPPDGGEGAGDDDSGEQGGGEGDGRQARRGEAKFTDADMAKMRRKYEAELEAVKAQSATLNEQMQELMGAIEEAIGEEGEDEGDEDEGDEDRGNRREKDEEIASLRSQMKKMNKTLEDLQTNLENERQARQEEYILRLETERDAIITKALTDNKAVSLEGGLKYFRDMLEYDADHERWVFIEKDTKAKLSVEDGIKEYLPDWLKESTVKKGGAGGRGSQPNQAIAKTVDDLKKLEEMARKDPSPTNIMAYNTKKKELAAAQGGGQHRPGGMGPQTRAVPAASGAADEGE